MLFMQIKNIHHLSTLIIFPVISWFALQLQDTFQSFSRFACVFFQGHGNVNLLGGGRERIPRGATMVGADWKKCLKIEDSRSLQIAISEFYQRLFERSVSSLIEPCVRFLTR